MIRIAASVEQGTRHPLASAILAEAAQRQLTFTDVSNNVTMPGLAQADVGMAMHSGTDIAMETADIVLMRDDLTDVLAVLDPSRSTFNKVRQNLSWTFGYNLVCIALAAGVLLPSFGIVLSPGFAGGFMALSSIGVVLNSLLLRWQLRESH